jgi:hypothetical protein
MEERYMHRGWRGAVLAALLGLGGAASAHEFECQKHINGQAVINVSEFPATLRFDHRIANLHPASESVASSLEDPVLAARGWRFKRPTPLAVQVGGAETSQFMLYLGSYEECVALAAEDGSDDGQLDTTFRVVWPMGEDQCTARLSCQLAPPPPDECEVYNNCYEPMVTRDEGFFKVYLQPLQKCLSRGAIDLGSLGTVSRLPEALGVLWGSPSLHRGGEPRSELDAQRFLLARQILIGECNSRLFYNEGRFSTHLEEGRQASSGTDCGELERTRKVLLRLNVDGLDQPLPGSVKQGTATPAQAQGLAHDFTQPSGQSCQ